MELADAVTRRRMVRAFRPDPVDPTTLARVLAATTRAPSAGFAQGLDLVLLDGPEQTGVYWDCTLPAASRVAFPWPGLLVAPVLVVACADPTAYVDRYAEADKARTGLGGGAGAWTVPFWFVDAGMAVENLLLAVVAEGLGACFFGVFDHEAALKHRLGIPDVVRTVGTIAIGHPDLAHDRPSRSSRRRRRDVGDVVHPGRW
jgi:nitroreductase